MADVSVLSLLPRLIVSMMVVILVMVIAARILGSKKLPGVGGLVGGGQAKRNVPIELVSRQGIGRRSAIAVVRAGDKHLVVGITEQNISLLAELQHLDLTIALPESQRTGPAEAPLALGAGPSWKGLLEQVRERTVRKV